MGIWDDYQSRMEINGRTMREVALGREQQFLQRKLPSSLSYHQVTIDGIPQNVAIINSDNLNEKYIFSLPGEDIQHGGYVYWMDNYWLVTERDANTEVYTRAIMIQCNFHLNWIDRDGVLHNQWCIIEDGTKYLTGEYEDRDFFVTRGDSRIAMTIAKNEFTEKFNRENRFLIDDPKSSIMLAYTLSKPLKLNNVFNEHGVYKFVLQEVVNTDDDNFDLMVADYYKYHKDDAQEAAVDDSSAEDTSTGNSGKKVWF